MSEDNPYVGEEIFGGTVVGDGFLVGRGDDDRDIAVGVEVILVSKNLTRVFPLFAWVPF